MSSPTRVSASRRRPRAAATPGRSTAARTSSRLGRTTPSPTGPGEAFYLRDDDTGAFVEPDRVFPSASRRATYIARIGRGFSRFEHTSHGIESDLLQFVPLDALDQDLATETAQSVGTRASSERHRLCGMGARPVALGGIDLRHDLAGFPIRRDLRPKSLERGFWLARRFRRFQRTPDRLDRRPPGIHRPQRDTGATSGAGQPAAPCQTISARASIPARPCAPASCWLPARASK